MKSASLSRQMRRGMSVCLSLLPSQKVSLSRPVPTWTVVGNTYSPPCTAPTRRGPTALPMQKLGINRPMEEHDRELQRVSPTSSDRASTFTFWRGQRAPCIKPILASEQPKSGVCERARHHFLPSSSGLSSPSLPSSRSQSTTHLDLVVQTRCFQPTPPRQFVSY
jgi:hypothetical protein